MARPGSAWWHDRATVHDLAVLPGTAVPGCAARILFGFRDFFMTTFILFLLRSLGFFRGRDLRKSLDFD